jgi:predicted RNA-binding protein YlqC (UPF0109 family)
MADQGLRASPVSYVEQERVGEGEQPDSRDRLLITRHGMEPKQLIEQIAKSIVDRPEMVEVKSVGGESLMVIELRVDKDDIRKVIGKSGRTITAIRTVLNAMRSQKDKRQILEILD